MSNEIEKTKKVANLIWMAMIANICVLSFVSNMVIKPNKFAVDNDQMKYIFCGIAFMDIIIAYFFRLKALKLLNDQRNEDPNKIQQVFTLCIVSWAITISCAVLGLVTIQTTGDYTIGNGLNTVGLICLILWRFPSVDNRFPKSYTT